MLKTIAVALLALLVATVATQSASAFRPAEIPLATITSAPARCVSGTEMRRLTQDWDDRYITYGVYFPWTGKIYLLQGRVCAPIARWWSAPTGTTPSQATIEAVHTVMHEGEHARGIHTEWKAECYSITPTLRFFKRYGGLSAYALDDIRYQLLVTDDRDRLSEYKLRGRCSA